MASAHAGIRTCERTAEFTPAQQDVLLRVAALVRSELAQSGARVALIARSGTDLSRFHLRYSHAGVSVQAHADVPWAVRQLYFACEEGRPRIFDQGLAGFVFGTDDPTRGFLSVVLLPPEAQAPLEAAVRDNALALQLLGGRYRANAYAWSTLNQNCNQWVAELLAAAWGGLAPGDHLRQRAQGWLHQAGYQPTAVDVGPWAGAAVFVPYLSVRDHPQADWDHNVNLVSLPEAIEAFVHQRWPQARRIEFCHRQAQVVIHRGWTPVSADCQPGEGDTLVSLTE